MKHRKRRSPLRRLARGTAVSSAAVAASVAVTMGVNAVAAEHADAGKDTAPTATRIGAQPADAAVDRSDIRAGREKAELDARRQRLAAQAAREGRQQRARAARSASRSVSYDGDPRRLAASMMAERYGWGSDQFSCLSSLWERESSWQVHAENPSSGAYGIPQALPGSKMSGYGADWRDNAVTQIEWGLSYIDQSYGTPCGAWSVWQSKGWY